MVRRRLPIFFTAVSALSLLLCMASIALWVTWGGERYFLLRGLNHPATSTPVFLLTLILVVVPDWLAVLTTSLLPLLWVWSYALNRLEERRLRRAGLCPVCGYDLRATPARCPECGTNQSPPVSTQVVERALSRWRQLCCRWLPIGVAVAGILTAAAFTTPHAAEGLRARAELREAYAACLSHVFPADTVVFDGSIERVGVGMLPLGMRPEDCWNLQALERVLYRSSRREAPATQPIRSSFEDSPPRGESWRVHNPDCLEWWWRSGIGKVRCASGLRPPTAPQLWPGDMVSGSEFQSLVFLHGRQTPEGEQRLVELRFDGPAFTWGHAEPFYDGGNPIRFTFAPDPAKALRLYAGQPDPTDATRFVIPYRLGDERFIIDCRLLPDGTIEMRSRDMP